jgi:thiol-disulfide isomerase/thioredoxin
MVSRPGFGKSAGPGGGVVRPLGEDQAVRTVFGVGLVFVCLGLAGCSLFGKKKDTADASPRNGSGGGVARNDTPTGERAPPNASGLLAGQVIDSFNNSPGGVMIQVVDLDEPKAAAAPIEVAADKSGYFTILGVQPGKHYQLIARTKDGDHLLSGSTIATAPNPRLRITVREDYTSPSTPPLPNPMPDKNKPKPSGPSATIQPPRQEGEDAGRPPAESNNGGKDPSKIVADDRWPRPPKADMKYVPPPRATDDDPLLPKIRSGLEPDPRDRAPIVQASQVPVPSCVLVGAKLDNFALFDLNGESWEYKRDRRGKLTLLHFWHSTCPPCLASIPELVKFQDTYGKFGLEVVGIAYEQGQREEQVRNVRATRGRYSINYTTLLGGPDDRCPVARDFKVTKYPILVLIDESGNVVTRVEGYDLRKFAELELEIRKRLDRR